MNGLELFTLAVAAALFALAAGVTLFAKRSPAADSPWFWVYVFSTAATVALFVMDGKYNHRQGHIEDEYRFGTRTVAKPSSDTPRVKIPESSAKTAGLGGETAPMATGPQPPTHELLISLGPLRVLAIVTMIISFIALQRRMVRGTRQRASDSQAPLVIGQLPLDTHSASQAANPEPR